MRPYTTAGGKDAHVRVESVKAAGRHGHPDLGRARAHRGEARNPMAFLNYGDLRRRRGDGPRDPRLRPKDLSLVNREKEPNALDWLGIPQSPVVLMIAGCTGRLRL